MSGEFAPIPFRVLKCIGLWRPIDWPARLNFAYSVFTSMILVVLVTIWLFVLIAVCQMPVNDDLFAENVFMMFALLNAIFKASNVLLSRERIINMLNMIQDERWCKLRNDEEIEIQNRYSKTIRFVLYFYICTA